MKKVSYALAAVTALIASSAYAHQGLRPAHVDTRSASAFAQSPTAREQQSYHVVSAYGRYLGQDPDANVRLQLLRNQPYASKN